MSEYMSRHHVGVDSDGDASMLSHACMTKGINISPSLGNHGSFLSTTFIGHDGMNARNTVDMFPSIANNPASLCSSPFMTCHANNTSFRRKLMSPTTVNSVSLPSKSYMLHSAMNSSQPGDMSSVQDLCSMSSPYTSSGGVDSSEPNRIASMLLENNDPQHLSTFISRSGNSITSNSSYARQCSDHTPYLSHSELTGLAAAAAHHATCVSPGNSPASNHGNMVVDVDCLGQSPGSICAPQASPAGSALETCDTGSGGSSLSISYLRHGDNYVCSLCGKVVASKAAITRHIQLTHEKRKPFECNICHRRFGYKNILLEHQNIHFGIKPYSCNLCDKRFAARSNLFQHRLLHMKPFHCEVCNKRFDRSDQLQRHLSLHPTSSLLSCNLCQFQANNVQSLNNHLRQSHTLQIFNTRSRFSQSSEMDSFRKDDLSADAQYFKDLPTQVPINKLQSPGPSFNTENEAMRKIDSICSQLASRNQTVIKEEPVSPDLSPVDSKRLSPLSCSSGRPPGRFLNSLCNADHHEQRVPFDEGSHGGRDGQQTGAELASSVYSVSTPQHHSSGHFTTSNYRPSLSTSIPGIQSFSKQIRPTLTTTSPSPAFVRSCADSTTSLSEFFLTLQSLIERSQDIPELNVSIGRPKSQQDAGIQHSAVTHQSGDFPALSDALAYYECHGQIYRCQHCKIIFEERGLFFLHRSLHGEKSPWECSICHKVCADRNDFHLHFINEQHHNTPIE